MLKKGRKKKLYNIPITKDFFFEKFINNLMLDGKKQKIENIISEVFIYFRHILNIKYPISLIFFLIKLYLPLITLHPRTRSGIITYAPGILNLEQRYNKAIKYIIQIIKQSSEHSIYCRISTSLLYGCQEQLSYSPKIYERAVHPFSILMDARIHQKFKRQRKVIG